MPNLANIVNNVVSDSGVVLSSLQGAITLTTTGTSGAATLIGNTLNIPQYQGGVTSFNTRTGAVTLSSSDVTTALGYTPVTNARTITINGTTYDLTANRSWTVSGSMPSGGTAGQILSKIDATDYNTQWIDNYSTQVKHDVKLGATISKGKAVYVSSADGTNMIVSAASNASESTSSKTLGLLETGGVTNDIVKVVTEGLVAGLDTSTATAGDPVWLGTSGNLIFGLANKPVAPAHLVFIGVVTRVQSNNGEIFVNVQNGFEIEELHNVLFTSKADKDLMYYDNATSLWKNAQLSTILGYTPYSSANPNNYIALTGLSSTATGLTYTNTTGVFSLTSGYVIPTTTQQTNWNTAYGWGNHASAGYLTSITSSNVTTALGYTPVTNARTLTINGTTYDLSADRSWTVSGSQWTTSGSNIYYNTGNVGIGTSTFIYSPKVSISSVGQNTLAIQTTDAVQGSTGTVLYLGTNDTTGNTYGVIRALTTGGTSSGNLVLNPTGGNVGIGTTSPSVRLEVQNGSSGADVRVSNTGGGYAQLSISSNASSAATLTYTNQLSLVGGNVGIGTSSPARNLDINGNLRVQGGAIDLSNDFNNQVYSSSNAMYLKVNGTERLSIASTGAATFSNSVSIPSSTAGGFFKMLSSASSSASREYRILNDAYGYGDFAIDKATTQGGSTFNRELILSGGNLTLGNTPSTGVGNLFAGAATFSNNITVSTASDSRTSYTVSANGGRTGVVGITDGANLYVTSPSAGNLYIGGGTNTYVNGGLKTSSGTDYVYNSGTWSINVNGSAGSLGGVTTAQIVYGDNATKTATFSDPNSPIPSGHWNAYTGTNMPYTSWWHLITNRHTNPDNNFQLQLAGEFWNNDYFLRKVSGSYSSTTSWARIVQSVSDPYAANMDQYVRTSDTVQFGGIRTGGSFTGYHASFKPTTNVTLNIGVSSGNIGVNGPFLNATRNGISDTTSVPMFFNGDTFNWFCNYDQKMKLESQYGDLFLRGYIYQGNTNWSDLRMKQNLKKIEDPLTKIKSINGYTFEWREWTGYRNTPEILERINDAGLIAQEVKEVLPEIVENDIRRDQMSLNYNGIIALHTEGMKQLIAENEALSKRVLELESKLL